MANSDKNIVIQPSIGSTVDQPSITFTGAGNSSITLKVLDDAEGTLSFEGYEGQVFAINNNLSSGVIYSVNDISGFPIIDADANGNVRLSVYSGNVGVGTTLATQKLDVNGTVKATTFSGSLTGTATTATNATNITLADESSDTTCFPIFATDATGNQAPKTDSSALTYNASTGALSATSFVGDLTGDVTGTATTATNATNITVADESSDTTCFPIFATDATGNQAPKTDSSALTYNASTGALSATSFVGTVTGTATTATNATNITLADESSDTTCFPIFATDATGNQAPKTDSSALTYNASTGALSATIFSGFNDRLYVGNLVGTAVTIAATPTRLVAVGYNVLKNINSPTVGGGNVINSPVAFGENSLTDYSVDFGGSGSNTIDSQISIGIGCLSTFNLTSFGGSRTVGPNIVMGYESGRTISGLVDNRTHQNVIVGYQNVYSNNFYNANNNAIFGIQCGYALTSGSAGNALFGYQSGYNVTTGDYNTLLGYQAGYSVQTGQYNIGIGYSAGQANMTGSRNIVIGYNRDVPNAAGNDQLVIGSNANDWIIGDSSYNVGFGTTNPSGAADPNNTQIVNAGIVTANFYYGDGSGLINLPAADVAPSDGQDFNTGITTTKYASASNDIDGFTAIAVTFPSTAGRKYLVESIHVTNISAGDLYITSRIDYDGGEDVPFTNKVLIPEQGAIDIVDQSFVCNPSDNIRLAAYNGIGATAGGILNGLDCFVTYTEKTDTNYIGIGSTTKSTFTDETVFTSNTNPSVINTITLTNNSDVADIDASVSMFRKGTIRQGYFVYNLTIPQNSSVQILPKAKRLNATDTIVVNSTSTDLGINVAGKYIT